jgi:hypothetical protein
VPCRSVPKILQHLNKLLTPGYQGSGSILAALRIGVPLIVVPNDGLLDGHQLELAVELSRQHYVVHGKLEYISQDFSWVLVDKVVGIFRQPYRTSKPSEHKCNSGRQ